MVTENNEDLLLNPEDTKVEDVKVEDSKKDTPKVETPEEAPIVEEEEVNPVQLFKKLLVEESLLSDEVEIESFEDIANQFKAKDDDIVKGYVDELPQDLKERIFAYREGKDYNKIGKAISETLDNVTDEMLKDEKIATKILETSLKRQGYSDEYIKKRVESAIDNDELEYESKIARDMENAYKASNLEKVKKEEEQRIIENKRVQEEWINNTKKHVEEKFADLPKNEQKALFESIVNPVRYEEGNGFKRPVSFIEDAITKDPTLLYKLNLAIMRNDFSGEVKKAKTTAAMQLDRFFRKKGTAPEERVVDIPNIDEDAIKALIN